MPLEAAFAREMTIPYAIIPKLWSSNIFIRTSMPSLKIQTHLIKSTKIQEWVWWCRPIVKSAIKLWRSCSLARSLIQEVTLLTHILVGSYAANSSSLFIVLCSFKPVSCSSFMISASSLLRPSTVFLISRLDAIS